MVNHLHSTTTMSTPDSPLPTATDAPSTNSAEAQSVPAAAPALTKTPEISALIRHLQSIARLTSAAQAVTMPTFLEGTPATPNELAAAFTDAAQAHSYYWVVTIGREPGLYLTDGAATDQTRGVPNQFQQRLPGLDMALAFYRNAYDQNKVRTCSLVLKLPASACASGIVRDGRELDRLWSLIDAPIIKNSNTLEEGRYGPYSVQ
ncbi:hypothetical protein C8R46DRAFT_1041460 [Mycena filopes]|nr:hypothetical protein C8R46DRAFT_1041460 [Mycena filopes]